MNDSKIAIPYSMIIKTIIAFLLFILFDWLGSKMGFLNSFIVAPIVIGAIIFFTGVQNSTIKSILSSWNNKKIKNPMKSGSLDVIILSVDLLYLVLIVLTSITLAVLLFVQVFFYIFSNEPYIYAINFTISIIICRVILYFASTLFRKIKLS